jgi:hypothetical protein
MTLKRALLLFAALPALALAQGDQSYDLQRKVKTGDTLKFSIRAELTIGENFAVMTGISTEKVIKVESDGTFSVESTTTEGKVEIEQEPQAIPPQAPSVSVYRSTGQVTEIRGDKIDSSLYRLANISTFQAPSGPVKIGDTWTRTFESDVKTGAVAATGKYTFEGLEKVGEIEAAKVKMSFEEQSQPRPATSEGYFWIDPTNGSLLKSELMIKNAPFPQSPFPIHAKLIVQRAE